MATTVNLSILKRLRPRMREISADAWEVDCDVLCITTNSTVYNYAATNNRVNVMGGGIAAGAARRFPTLPQDYAKMIDNHGHHVFLVGTLLMFPTKNNVRDPASIQRIVKSIQETKVLADLYGWRTIALPRPGSGLGGLDWHTEVKPAIKYWLDERFLIVSYPGEA